MRYLITVLAAMLYYCPSYAGEVWVVNRKPAKSVWVVAAKPVQPAITPKAIAKTCDCSNQCACGCNSGKECNCNQPAQGSVYYGPTSRPYASQPSTVCIGGT